MRTHLNIQRLFVFAFSVAILASSCSKYPYQTRWKKDYDSYQIGAYINGKEFHEAPRHKYFAPYEPETIHCGFRYYEKDSLVMIEDVFSSHCPWMDAKGKEFYDWGFYMIIDKSSYKPNDTYSFNSSRTDPDYYTLFFRGEYECFEDLPLVVGSFKKRPYYEPLFFVTEGEISFGSFDEDGRNKDAVHFNLKAEDEDGNVIVVKHGYCKKYATL